MVTLHVARLQPPADRMRAAGDAPGTRRVFAGAVLMKRHVGVIASS
jgi:hypothetical protein